MAIIDDSVLPERAAEFKRRGIRLSPDIQLTSDAAK
jgi:hypothetical protein